MEKPVKIQSVSDVITTEKGFQFFYINTAPMWLVDEDGDEYLSSSQAYYHSDLDDRDRMLKMIEAKGYAKFIPNPKRLVVGKKTETPA